MFKQYFASHAKFAGSRGRLPDVIGLDRSNCDDRIRALFDSFAH
jgi:hypothetical protein